MKLNCIVVAVAFKSHMQVDAGGAETFSEQVIESIINDSHSGMSAVAFHTAPTNLWTSLLLFDPEMWLW